MVMAVMMMVRAMSVQVLLLIAICSCSLLAFSSVKAFKFTTSAAKVSKVPNLCMKLTPDIELYGSQQTRSPLVNWFLLEKKIPFTQRPPRPSNHPFGQVPFLSDQKQQVQVFESGAILLYLADAYGYHLRDVDPEKINAVERSLYVKWVVWANAELDGLCFGKGMSGTQLDKPNKAFDKLDEILANKSWLVNDEFTVADVAVGSYLNYVPVFFQNVRPARQNIIKYMQRCAQRPAFTDAFGDDHARYVLAKCKQWIK